MEKNKNFASETIKTIRNNVIEIWATLSIFIGLPAVAWVYFDYRAALLVFVLASIIIGTMAVRVK